jgi:hypothetical protein
MPDNAFGRSMEDLFFYENEQRLIEARRELKQMQETKENLAKVSGIQNDAVLEKLVALNMRPETLATLFAIPLIEVAWADGEMHAKEREELFRFAEKAGLRNKSVDREIMAAWLKQKPDPALMEAWVHYIQALSLQLSKEECRALRDDVLADARVIAQAAGGFLGFGKLSNEEQSMLVKLEAAFG